MKNLACLAIVACWLCGLPASHVLALVDQPIVEPPEVVAAYAAAGDPSAQYNLGIHYSKGDGVARDPKQAIEWFRRAAQAGFAPAQYNPASTNRIEALYANAEKCVRVLVEKLPSDGLPIFVNDLIAGNSPDAAFAHAYGKKCPDTKAFAALVDAN